MRESGFTLIEMLVALVIFALLASAGVGLLRSSVDTQAAVGERLADLAASERLRLLLASDLSQAVDRPSRDENGGSRLAFAGSTDGLRLVRTGWSRPDGSTGLQAVEWRAGADGLSRRGSAVIDGRLEGTPAALLDGVEQVTFRYRAITGEWLPSWAPSATEPPLPGALELVVKRQGEAPVRIVLALPPSSPAAPPPAAVPAETDPGAGAAA